MRLVFAGTPEFARTALTSLHHAGVTVASFDGTLYGCGAAPARQQGRVYVQTTVWHAVQCPFRKQQTVGNHHHQFGVCISDGLL